MLPMAAALPAQKPRLLTYSSRVSPWYAGTVMSHQPVGCISVQGNSWALIDLEHDRPRRRERALDGVGELLGILDAFGCAAQ